MHTLEDDCEIFFYEMYEQLQRVPKSSTWKLKLWSKWHKSTVAVC